MNESKLFDMMVKRVNFKGIEDEIAKNTIDKINKSINPELLTNFNIMYQEITRIFNHFEPIIKKLEKQSKKVINCETLYEDVYKVRDEIKTLKSDMVTLKKGFKKIFD